MRISDSLTEEILAGLVSEEQLKMSVGNQAKSQLPLYDQAVSDGIISETDFARAYAQQTNTPFVELDQPIDSDLMNYLAVTYARRFNAVVFDKGPGLKIAMANINDQPAKEFLQKLLGVDIQFFLAPEINIQNQLSRYDSTNPSEHLKIVRATPTGSGTLDEEGLQAAFQYILSAAIKKRAQSIHIEPQENLVSIRFRVDGTMVNSFKLSKPKAQQLIDFVKQQAGLDIHDTRSPQSGSILVSHGSSNINIRLSVLPVLDGSQLTLGLLYGELAVPSLEYLGYWGDALKIIDASIAQPNGLIAVGAPAGSDTQTVLCSIVTNLRSSGLSIFSIEARQRYRLDRVSQIELSPSTGLDIHKALSLSINHHPDVLMVDNLPNQKSVQQIMDMTNRQLVIASVRAKSLEDTNKYLTIKEVPPLNVRCMIFQRPVRKLCPICRQLVDINPNLRSRIDNKFQTNKSQNLAPLRRRVEEAIKTIPSSVEISQLPVILEASWQPNVLGCEACNFTGYKGWINIVEAQDSNINLAMDALIKSQSGLIPIDLVLEC